VRGAGALDACQDACHACKSTPSHRTSSAGARDIAEPRMPRGF
jgi:hypothetical protein